MADIGVQMMMLKDQVAEGGMFPVLEKLKDLGIASVEVSQIRTARSRGVVGVTSWISARPRAAVTFASDADSSSGRSGTIRPATPRSATASQYFSTPWR